MTDIAEWWQELFSILYLPILSIALFLFLILIVAQICSKLRHHWSRSSWVGRVLILLFLGVDILYGGSKARMASVAPEELSSPVHEVTVLSEYHEPIFGVPDENVFVRPGNAITPERWINHAVSDDWQIVAEGFVASASGFAAMANHGFSDWSQAAPIADVYAPYPVTLSLIPGISEFWSVTNNWMKRFAWKNALVDRVQTNQISFAVQLWDCGDVAFVYDRSLFDLHDAVPFVQLGTERLIVTNTVADCNAVFLRRDHTQTESWWLKHHPEFCKMNELGQFEWIYDTNEYYKIEIDLQDDKVTRALAYDTITISLEQNRRKITIYQGNNREILWNDKISTQHSITHLKTGLKYRIEADCMIRRLTVPPDVVKRRISDRCFELERPIVMAIAGDDAIREGYGRYTASISPKISGGNYTWSASGPFKVLNPDARSTEVVRTGKAAGTITCTWKHNDLQSTSSIAFPAVADYTPAYLSITPPNVIILTEGAHLNAAGQICAATNRNAQVVLSYRGTSSGDITLSSNINGLQAICDGAHHPLPWTLSVDSATAKSIYLDGIGEHSGEIELQAKFKPENSSEELQVSQQMLVAQLAVEADAEFPIEKRRHVFGPMESATMSISPSSLTVEWRDGETVASGPTMHLQPALTALNKTVMVSINGFEFAIPVAFIAPIACIATSARAMNDDDWRATGFAPLQTNEIGAGLCTELMLQPNFVSFTGLHIQEGECPATNIWGYYEPFAGTIGGHGPSEGAYFDHIVGTGNTVGIDRAGYALASAVYPLADGGYEFQIPMYWSIEGAATNQFTINRQIYRLFPDGSFKVSKFGYSAHRTRDGITSIIRE